MMPEEGLGIVTPSCDDPTPFEVARQVGIGLRIGGEASLCFSCGPDGGVYHPDGLTIDAVKARAFWLTFTDGELQSLRLVAARGRMDRGDLYPMMRWVDRVGPPVVIPWRSAVNLDVEIGQ